MMININNISYTKIMYNISTIKYYKSTVRYHKVLDVQSYAFARVTTYLNGLFVPVTPREHRKIRYLQKYLII